MVGKLSVFDMAAPGRAYRISCLSFAGHAGWLNQTLVWGAYPGEMIKD